MTTERRLTGQNARGSRRQRRTHEPGFTLIELMVALAVGAIAITSVYAVGAASSQQFREQQRVSGLQSSLRMAINQLKRDIGRIGYHATPNINRAGETCMNTNLVVPIALNEDADIGLIQTSDFAQNVLHADQMTVMGNYVTRSEYLLDGLANMGTTQAAFLQTEWQAFRRSFVRRAFWGQTFAMNMLNTGEFQSVFRANRWMRLQNRDGFKFFVTIDSTAWNQGRPQINFISNPTLPLGGPCVGGNMSGGKAAPLSMIRYRLFDGTNDPEGTSQDNAAFNGANIQLVREEVQPDNPGLLLSAGDAALRNSSRRVLLDYVVSFNVRAVMDANAGVTGQPPCMWLYDNGANMSPPGTCGIPASGNDFASMTSQIRTLIIDLSVRTPEPDMNFPWPGGQITGLPITRYRPQTFISNNRTEAFRVRSLHAEIFVPNLI